MRQAIQKVKNPTQRMNLDVYRCQADECRSLNYISKTDPPMLVKCQKCGHLELIRLSGTSIEGDLLMTNGEEKK